RITVRQRETPQLVPVLVRTQGEIASGYSMVSIEPDPRTVQVTGPLEVLQTLDAVETDPIDITGASTTLARSVRIQLPEGVKAERETVNVMIQIVPTPGSRAIAVAPTVVNVPPGLTATPQTSAVTVRLSGPMPRLNEITPADIQATVDAAGLPEGVHTLGVTVRV